MHPTHLEPHGDLLALQANKNLPQPLQTRPLLRAIVEWLVMLAIFLSVARRFAVDVGVSVRLYELTFLPLIACGLLLFAFHRPQIPRPILLFLALKWAFFGVALSSLGAVLFTGRGLSGLIQFAKGITVLAAETTVLTIVALVFVSASCRARRRLMRSFFAGVLASTIYGIVQLVAIIGYNLDIDAIVSQAISASSTEGISRYAVGNFYRFTGFAGDPNIQATFILSLLVCTGIAWIYRRTLKRSLLLLYAFVILVLTMSNSGLLGLLVSTTLIPVLFWRRVRFRHWAIAATLALLLSPAVITFSDSILHFAKSRTDPEGTVMSHLEIAFRAFEMWLAYPIGVGYNNFAGVFGDLFPEYGVDMNPHNSFLVVLCELGPTGLFLLFATIAYTLFTALRTRGATGKALVCWLLGTAAAACGYQSFELFYTQLFWTALFALVCIGDHSAIIPNAPPKRGPHPRISFAYVSGAQAN